MLNMLKTSFTKVKPNALPGLRYGVFQERNGIVRGRVGILGITFLNEAPAQLVGVGVAEVLQASRGNEEGPRWGCSGERDEGEKGKEDMKEVLEELHSEVSIKGWELSTNVWRVSWRTSRG